MREGHAAQSADSRDVGECIVVDAGRAWIIIHVFVLLHFIQISYRAVFTFCQPHSRTHIDLQFAIAISSRDLENRLGPQEMLMNVQLHIHTVHMCICMPQNRCSGDPLWSGSQWSCLLHFNNCCCIFIFGSVPPIDIRLMKTNNSGDMEWMLVAQPKV